MSVEDLSSDNFKEKIGEKDRLVIVDLWAEWCRPCKMIEPFIVEIAENYKEKVSVYRVNIENYPDIASHYNVMYIPTVIFFRDGKEIDRLVGAMPQKEYKDKVEEHLGKGDS